MTDRGRLLRSLLSCTIILLAVILLLRPFEYNNPITLAVIFGGIGAITATLIGDILIHWLTSGEPINKGYGNTVILRGQHNTPIQLENNPQQKYPRLSIVGIMRRKRTDQTFIALIMLTLALAAQALLNYFSPQRLDNLIITILLALILLLVIRKFTFDYRVKSGLYGNNEREAREIIEFILKESEDIDFTDGGKPKKIISAEDLEEIQQYVNSLLPANRAL